MYRTLCYMVFVLLVLGVTGDVGASRVAHWRLDEGAGTDAFDSSGNGFDGTLMGDPVWVTGVYGGALEFDGAGDYVDVTDFTGWPDGDAPRSLTGWGLTYTIAGGWRWIATYGSEGTGLACFIGINGTDLYGGGYGDDIYTAGFYVVNEWHHAALTYDGTTARLYADGIEVASAAKSWNTTLGRAHLGQQVNNFNEFWNGLIDDVRLYNHVLSVEELADVMAGLIAEQARRPRPAADATDIPRDAPLSWTPGKLAATHDVYFGTVQEDVEAASRTDDRGVLMSQGQTATTFDPGLLEYGQTYYWRIDEISAAPDNVITKGVVWSFMAEPLTYPVANVTATTNGTSDPGMGPENTVNNSGLNADDQHSTESEDMWAAMAADEETFYIEFAFDRIYKLQEMLVWNYNVEFEPLLGFGLKDVTVQYSGDGADWTALGDVVLTQATARNDYVANNVIDFQGVAAQYVRLIIHTGYGMMGKYGLSEVRFMYKPVHARAPQPADGATNINPNTDLGWHAGREAASHEVYIDVNETAVVDGAALVDTVTNSSYPLESLDVLYDSTYYWKIVEVNEAEMISRWEGETWSFATESYGLVEDFESYDDEDNTIFNTWIDGWVNETGSTVGYLEMPFAETVVVHGGSQSMPLMYDNSGGISISEAERTFDAPQDWTGNGIQTLTLHFRGLTSNSGGQLYLKINDTKVVYDGAATDLNAAIWLAWNVDLSAVGANLANVTKLTIGIEGAGARGKLYVDDIRLYPRTGELVVPVEPDTANLVGYYMLDGNANDNSGNGYNGTEMNGPSYLPGVEGQAVQFNGSEQYIDIGAPARWPSGAAPRSMVGWARTSSTDAGWRWIAAYGSAGGGQAMFIGLNGTTLYGGGYADDVLLTNFWEADEWHHIGLTYDGTTARLYADGAEVASASKTWNLVPGRAHIGRQVNDAFEFWSGSVDEVRIYDRVLSDGEMAWLAGRTSPLHKPF